MLRTMDNILGYRLASINGEIGRVHDYLVDDTSWKLRYLVVETGSWLNRRRVLVSPAALGQISRGKRDIIVKLMREQVQRSPDIDSDKPVSPQQERAVSIHYGWPAYWAPDGMPGADPVFEINREQKPTNSNGDPHLRSFLEISTYRVEHAGVQLGTAENFVIEEGNWLLQLLIVGLGGWIGSVQVAVPIESVSSISWADRAVTVSMSKEQFGKLPLFDPEAPVNREEKLVYFDYHGRHAAGQ